MKNVAVANPEAASGRVRKWWAASRVAIEAHLGPVEVKFTERPRQATILTRRAIDEGAKRIIAVGGDGTINEVVNGFVDTRGAVAPDVTLVAFPGGTGGDFVRSIGMAGRDVEQALAVASERRIDLGRATVIGRDGCEVVRHFINISSFGSSGLIVDKVNKATKALGGRASYLIGTVKGLIQYRNQRVRLRVDDETLEQVVNTVAVANGRFFGGSMMIAPWAILDDGLFDVVIVGDVGPATFLRYLGRIYRGEHLGLPEITVLTGKSVEALPLGKASVFVDVDGEQPGRLPAHYEVLPLAISVLAPWTRAVGVRPRD